MPNNFKVKTSGSIGATAHTVYTCPTGTQTTVIGLNLANILTTGITANVLFENADSDNISIIKNAPIPTGSALPPIGGTQKLVMEAGDLLKVSSSDASSVDCAISVLEVS